MGTAVTAIMNVSAKFKNKNNDLNVNKRLLERIEQVTKLLDEMNELFAKESYQEEVKKCTDRRGVMRTARSVHFKVLPEYGIEATEKGTAMMASWISCVQQHRPIQERVDKSMDISGVKNMILLPPIDPPPNKSPKNK